MTRIRTISLLFFFLAAFVPFAAYGQQPATKDEITVAFVGHTGTFAGYSGGAKSSTATFGADGNVNFVHYFPRNAAYAGGHFVISDGQICVTYTSGRNDTMCYAVRNNGDGSFSWQSPGQGYVSITFN